MTATVDHPTSNSMNAADIPVRGATLALDEDRGEDRGADRGEDRAQLSKFRGSGVILAGIILIAANLRLCVSATGALLNTLTVSLHLSPGVASALTSIWPLAFAVGGVTGAGLARRFNVSTVLTGATVVLIAGSALRGVSGEAALLAGSLLAGLGIALANVLLPAAVRQYFPERIGLVTGLYATALSTGSAVAAGVSVPLAQGLGSPEYGLAFWGLPAVIALGVWVAARRQKAAHRTDQLAAAAAANAGPVVHIPLRSLTRSPMAWSMAALFALQSMGAYVVMGWFPSILEDAGLSAARAGAMLSAVFFINIPLSFIVPILGSRMRDKRPLFLALSLAMAAAFLGLIIAPVTLIWVWVVLAGFGLSIFPVVLALFSVRGGSAAGTAALSTFGQAVGYLGAAIAPVAVGLLRTSTGSWTIPLMCMVVVSFAQCAVSMYVASSRHQALSSGADQ
jgi:CP family cyanate transporter-like MFS transporter